MHKIVFYRVSSYILHKVSNCFIFLPNLDIVHFPFKIIICEIQDGG